MYKLYNAKEMVNGWKGKCGLEQGIIFVLAILLWSCEIKEITDSPYSQHLKILSRIINLQIVWPPVHTDLLSLRICMQGSRIECGVVFSLLLINGRIIKKACGLAFSNFRLWCFLYRCPGCCHRECLMWWLLSLVPYLSWCSSCGNMYSL